MKTKYPIYIPSKGRWENNLTADLLFKNGIEFKLVVENNEFEKYLRNYPIQYLLPLDGSNFGHVSYARNFIKNHAKDFRYHWQIDDDVAGFMYCRNRQTLSQDTFHILSAVEQFTEKYTNIGICGLGSSVFGKLANKEYLVNRFAYTCMLIRSDLPCSFRSHTEEDLDFNLQVLTSGLNTVQFAMYLFKWSTTGTRAGGYTELNANGGRLERQKKTMTLWPQFLTKLAPKGNGFRIVTNHVWKNFKQPLA